MMLLRTPSKGSRCLKRTALCYFKGPSVFGPHQSFAEVSEFLPNEMKERNQTIQRKRGHRPALTEGDGTGVQAAHFWSRGGHFR